MALTSASSLNSLPSELVSLIMSNVRSAPPDPCTKLDNLRNYSQQDLVNCCLVDKHVGRSARLSLYRHIYSSNIPLLLRGIDEESPTKGLESKRELLRHSVSLTMLDTFRIFASKRNSIMTPYRVTYSSGPDGVQALTDIGNLVVRLEDPDTIELFPNLRHLATLHMAHPDMNRAVLMAHGMEESDGIVPVISTTCDGRDYSVEVSSVTNVMTAARLIQAILSHTNENITWCDWSSDQYAKGLTTLSNCRLEVMPHPPSRFIQHISNRGTLGRVAVPLIAGCINQVFDYYVQDNPAVHKSAVTPYDRAIPMGPNVSLWTGTIQRYNDFSKLKMQTRIEVYGAFDPTDYAALVLRHPVTDPDEAPLQTYQRRMHSIKHRLDLETDQFQRLQPFGGNVTVKFGIGQIDDCKCCGSSSEEIRNVVYPLETYDWLPRQTSNIDT